MSHSSTTAPPHNCARCGGVLYFHTLYRNGKEYHPECAPLSVSEQATQGWSYGWVCPACGRGNSPFNPTCLCKPFPQPVVT